MPILRSVELQNIQNLKLPYDLLDYCTVYTVLERDSFQPYQLPVLEQWGEPSKTSAHLLYL